MTLRKLSIGLAGLLCAVALVAGCSSDKTTNSGVGTVRMFVTDAPATIQAVNLMITGVSIHRAGADTDSVSGWETLRSDSVAFELLSLRGGVLGALSVGTVPAGHYDQVRLKIGPGSTVVDDGVTYPLIVPSGAQSGLKLVGSINVTSGGSVDVALDFDASRSIHKTGAGTYILSPVIRVVVLATTGSIVGSVSPATTLTTVRAISGTDTVQTTTTTGTAGHFTLAQLSPGTYTVAFHPASGFRDTSLTGIAVTAGGATDVGTVMLTATAGEPSGSTSPTSRPIARESALSPARVRTAGR
jgi:hypothetical protein